MRILLLLFLLSGCATQPVEPVSYQEALVGCTEHFLKKYGTKIADTYMVCKDIYGGNVWQGNMHVNQSQSL